jgi:hypothetical protein
MHQVCTRDPAIQNVHTAFQPFLSNSYFSVSGEGSSQDSHKEDKQEHSCVLFFWLL